MNQKVILERPERDYMSDDSCQDIEFKSIRVRAGYSLGNVKSQNMGFRVVGYGLDSVHSYSQDEGGSNGISPFRLLTV